MQLHYFKVKLIIVKMAHHNYQVKLPIALLKWIIFILGGKKVEHPLN